MLTMFDEINEWKAQKLGKISASEIHKLLKSGKKKDEYFGAGAISYINEKIAEIITGEPVKDISNLYAIQWGLSHETEAVLETEERIGEKIIHYGGNNPQFFEYNTYSGASLDAETEDKVIEIKCPYTSEKHAANLIASLSPKPLEWFIKNREEYYIQMQMQMMCVNKKEGLFGSYDPRPIDKNHRLALIEVPADEKIWDTLKERIEKAGEIIKAALKLLFPPSVILAELDSETNTIIIT